MINFIIGTKAQYIKCIPVINNFIENDVKISIYDLKQHSQITSKLRNKITNNYEYIEFSKNNKNLGTYFGLIKWFINNLFKIIFIDKIIEISVLLCSWRHSLTLLGAF